MIDHTFAFLFAEYPLFDALEGEGHMLRSRNDLEHYAIRATDGIIGRVKDCYFDDQGWVIRYLVVDTGTWLSDRKVLISPIAIGHADRKEKLLPVSITKEQIKNSPDIDTEKPVSRQHEIRYLEYYGYPYYWGDVGLWGGGAYPSMLMTGYSGFGTISPALRPRAEEDYARAEAAQHHDDDPHLRSCKAVMSYEIHAIDGDIGYVQGLLVDEDTWAIRYIIVDTSNWWLGHQLLIPTEGIAAVSWSDAKVSINLARQAVKDAPPYDPAVQLDRNQESGIYKHYGRLGYGADGEQREVAN